MGTVILKAKREGPLQYRHPWIFSGAIDKIEGSPQLGQTVEIKTGDGKLWGRGAYSPHSQIAVRLWTFDPEEAVDADFFSRRLSRAVHARKELPEFSGNSRRLVFSESDGLPGVIVDQYADFLICQFLSAGAEFWKPTIVSVLSELVSCRGIYERSDTDSREKEGLPPHTGVLYGDDPPDLVEITEGAGHFLVDVKRGHKTGFYLDQRENRFLVAQYLRDQKVLDCFCYTGGFTAATLAAGAASVVGVDASAQSLDLARRNIALNGLNPSNAMFEENNVSPLLRLYRDSRRQFDAIILDPPKFIHSRSQLEQAGRGYKDINLMAMKLLTPGGILATFSCSQMMTPDLFQRMVAYASVDAKRDVQILKHLHQAPDHPVALNFPEAGYLKGLICRVW